MKKKTILSTALLFSMSLSLFASQTELARGPGDGYCKLPSRGIGIAPSNSTFHFLTQNLVIDCSDFEPGTPMSVIPIKFFFENEDGEPIKGVVFEPVIISGELDEQSSSNEGERYRGILTQESEWLTDNCGIGLVEIRPKCSQRTNLIRILIHSGSVSGRINVRMKR